MGRVLLNASEPRGGADRYRRSAALISGAIGLSGLLLYAFFALASHTLTRDEYGEIVVLWLLVFGIVSILFRPVEQLLARELAVARAAGTDQVAAMRSAALISLALVVAFVAVALALEGPIRDDLFSGESFLFWALVAGVIAFGGDYYVRGVLAGRGRFDLYAVQLVAECAVLLGAGALGALGVLGEFKAFATAIAVAPLLGVAVAIAVRLTAAMRGERQGVEPAPSTGGLAGHGGFAAAVLVVMFCEQVLINAGPLFVRGAEGAAAAGFMFNLLMVARAPAALFQGVAASLLPHLARALSDGDEQAFRAAVRSTLSGIAAFTTAALVGLLAIGPWAMGLVFGEKFDYERDDLMLIAVGMGALLASATLTQACLARGRAAVAAIAWACGAIAFVVWNLTEALNPVDRVEIGFLATTAVLAVALYVIERPASRPDDSRPDAADVFQARLAASDDPA